jgi:hypothetical protein
MKYIEVSNRLLWHGIEADNSVHALKSDAANATALYMPPVAWFVAFSEVNCLFLGTYLGEKLILMGTRQISFNELTPELLDQEIKQAKNDWFNWRFGLC